MQATPVRSPNLRGRDSYNHLSRTHNTFQTREVVLDEAWSRGAEWSQQKTSSVNTAALTCGEGDSFTLSSQKYGELAGCYIKTGTVYTFENRMGKKYIVDSGVFKDTYVSPDVRDVADVVELYLEHYQALC